VHRGKRVKLFPETVGKNIAYAQTLSSYFILVRGTDARQSNPNLLLSREASADTKPQLEIFADDVQCQHGATVGQIDPEELFYLRSRGLDEAAARGILTLGFAREITRRAEPAWVREYVERRLLETFDFAGVVPDAPAELPSGIRSA
jgi:Fe-S cluster assembly protein SufD